MTERRVKDGRDGIENAERVINVRRRKKRISNNYKPLLF